MAFYSPIKQIMSHQNVSMIKCEKKYFSPHALKKIELCLNYSADVVEKPGKSDSHLHLTTKSCVCAI